MRGAVGVYPEAWKRMWVLVLAREWADFGSEEGMAFGYEQRVLSLRQAREWLAEEWAEFRAWEIAHPLSALEIDRGIHRRRTHVWPGLGFLGGFGPGQWLLGCDE